MRELNIDGMIIGRGNPKYLEENMPQSHFVPPQIPRGLPDFPGIDLGSSL
jgi:hypothetical protein